MKTKTIEITEIEARQIFGALRLSIAGFVDLRPDHNYSEAENFAVKIMQAEIMRDFFKIFPFDGTEKVKLTVSRWCAVYCALDLYWNHNHFDFNQEYSIACRNLFSKLFKLINAPII
jgi:hypothetical protein